MEIQCGCHCIKCNSTKLESKRIGKTEENGYFDMHHTCKECDTHFDHLKVKLLILVNYAIIKLID